MGAVFKGAVHASGQTSVPARSVRIRRHDIGCRAAAAGSAHHARIYIFDNGTINGLDPKMFGFTREEVKEPDFVGGLVPDRASARHADVRLRRNPGRRLQGRRHPAVDGIMRATRQLKPQMAAIGYKPSDVTYFALSHYHSDHTANANDVRRRNLDRAEGRARRDVRVQSAGRSSTPAHFSALKNAKTKLLDNEDFDVFGDGTVVIKSAPGHTPGHQVLFVKLAKRGPVLLVGDLYHYPEE